MFIFPWKIKTIIAIVCFAGENDDIVAVSAVSGIVYLFSIKDGKGKQKIDQPIIQLNGQPKSKFLRYSLLCVVAVQRERLAPVSANEKLQQRLIRHGTTLFPNTWTVVWNNIISCPPRKNKKTIKIE